MKTAFNVECHVRQYFNAEKDKLTFMSTAVIMVDEKNSDPEFKTTKPQFVDAREGETVEEAIARSIAFALDQLHIKE